VYSQLPPSSKPGTSVLFFSFAKGRCHEKDCSSFHLPSGFCRLRDRGRFASGGKGASHARPACAQFGGWYVGANVGYGYLQHNFQDRDFLAGTIDTGLPRSTQDTNSGVNGGVRAGYNYQTGCTLFGVEAGWVWSDTNASSFNSDGDGPVGTPGVDTSTVSSRMRWFGTVRARSGVVVDNVLIYATGGFTYANFAPSYTIFEDAPATTSTFTRNNTKWGWTAGVGTEWAFAPNWSLKSEVLYMRFEKDTATATGLGAPGAGLLGAAYRLESQMKPGSAASA
jgi:outer membrane immunogenic protein